MFSHQPNILAEAVSATQTKDYINVLTGLNTTNEGPPRNGSVGNGSFSSKPSTNLSHGTGKYSLGGTTTTKGGLIDSILPHAEGSAHETNHWKSTDQPKRSPRKESRVGWSRRKPRGSESEEDAPRTPPDDLRHDGSLPMRPKTKPNGDLTSAGGQHKIQREIEQLFDGVVDLRDTVDEDKDVTWAPGTQYPALLKFAS